MLRSVCAQPPPHQPSSCAMPIVAFGGAMAALRASKKIGGVESPYPHSCLLGRLIRSAQELSREVIENGLGSVCPPVGCCLFIVASNRGFISGHRSAWHFHLCMAVQAGLQLAELQAAGCRRRRPLGRAAIPSFYFLSMVARVEKHGPPTVPTVVISRGVWMGRCWGHEGLSCSDPVLACRVGIGVRGEGAVFVDFGSLSPTPPNSCKSCFLWCNKDLGSVPLEEAVSLQMM